MTSDGETPVTRAGELTTLQWRVIGFAALVVMVAGFAALASGPVDQVLATYRQHEASARADIAATRYATALGVAYDVVVDDFEDALVSFEFGALPTTVNGEVIGLPPPPIGTEPGLEATSEVEDLRPPEAAAVEAPPSGDEPATAQPSGTAVFGGGIIRIPAIGLNQAVGEGVDREHLKLGPGHYPGTALPGQEGNVVISGHRTTYTHPFRDLDLLGPGDEILLDSAGATHIYRVSEILVVSADNVEPLRGTGDIRLTLTTCHPKGSARQRLVVVAFAVTVPPSQAPT